MPSSKASKGTISAPAIEESFFGYGSCRPKCLQFLLNNPKAFLFFLTFANIIQGICINGLLKVCTGRYLIYFYGSLWGTGMYLYNVSTEYRTSIWYYLIMR